VVGQRLLNGSRVNAVVLSPLSTAVQVKAWVATDKGVAEVDIAAAAPFDPATAAVVVTWHDTPQVRDSDVRSLALSPEGKVYAGTVTGFSEVGFASLGPSLRAAPYNFPSEFVQALLFERRSIAGVEHELLWAGTRNGLVRYDLAVGIASRLSTTDGLPSNDVRSLALGPGGVKYLGTAAGLGRYSGN
jgi:ligand-binding sensor domain-containing protein